ncbi:MAG TPA: LLM class F420-dependent oxidoreductase [Chiayiivirga sp.]|nr:LLM class F420-dependent oxidoreductase [Chiayiivirga sp.]HRP71714.1 LLM class F420-dependent oxidoreductase [Luteimonas sp.]HRQ64192.1 LLM class F420-dependent oxidoreductase [Xanthomonadaceae bacterium]
MISGVKFGTNLYRFPSFGPELEPMVEFVKLSEQLGFDRLRLLDHVVGIVAERHGGIAETPYTDKSTIREVFTLMAYLSAITTRIHFVTGVLGLPQRQTVLAAKQAAEVDILSGGRLTLGVAVGYNPLEFDAMGASFPDRGKRFEEQIDVMRRLWTEPDVSYDGQWHKFADVSLSPRPVQRPIPLFFGLGRKIAPIPPDVVLKRVGRLADGWLPIFKPGPEGKAAVATMEQAAVEAGRDPKAIVMEMTLDVSGMDRDAVLDHVRTMRDFGVHHVNFSLPGASAAEHIDALKRLADMLAGARD